MSTGRFSDLKENLISPRKEQTLSISTPPSTASQDESSEQQKMIRKPLLHQFANREGYSWDYAIAFRNPKDVVQKNCIKEEVIDVIDNDNDSNGDETQSLGSKTRRLSVEEVCQKLYDAGLEIKVFYSSLISKETKEPKFIFCKVRAHHSRLELEADRIDFSMLLNKEALGEKAQAGWPEHNIAPFEVKDELKLYPFQPYEYIYMKFDTRPDLQEMYQLDIESQLFSNVHRLKLIESIIIHTEGGGAGLDLEALINNGSILACFPLHDAKTKQELQDQWLKWNYWPSNQPFQLIRSYFGAKITLYFEYLGCYTTWLSFAAIFGSIMTIIGVIAKSDNTNNKHEYELYTVPLTGMFTVIWATLFIEHWKRKNSILAMQWGMSDFHEEEQPRPQFQGLKVSCALTGKSVLYFSTRNRCRRQFVIYSILFILICIVLALAYSIVLLRNYLVVKINFQIMDFPLGGPVSAVANVCQIYVMNKIYDHVSIRMNNYENHYTETDYENAFIFKSIMFHFVNNFAVMFYITLHGYDAALSNESRLSDLRMTLGIVYIIQLLAGNFNEIFVPRLLVYLERFKHKAQDKTCYGEVEHQFFQYDYGWFGTYEDYLEMVIQFGFSTLFVASLPITPLFSFINNILEIRIDAYRLLHDCRRPVPRSVSNIGLWIYILEVIVTIMAFTNAFVTVFTAGVIDDNDPLSRKSWIMFFCVVSVFMFFRYIIATSIDDVPKSVKGQIGRQEFFVSKVLHRAEDDIVADYVPDTLYQFEIQQCDN